MKHKQVRLISRDLWELHDKELLNLIIGREGGRTTSRIIDMILRKPYNKNQLADKLNLDYNTISYHMNIIENHNYVRNVKFGKVSFFHPTEKLFKSLDEYKLIKEYLLNNK